MFLNFRNCRQPILSLPDLQSRSFCFSSVFPFFQASFTVPCLPTLRGNCLQCNPKQFCKIGATTYSWQTLFTLERISGAFFRKRDESFFRAKFQSPALSSLWENHGRSEGIHNWNPKLWKGSMWKASKKKYLVFCESMDTKWKKHSLHISKTEFEQFWNRISNVYSYCSPQNISTPWSTRMTSLFHCFYWPSRWYNYQISK